MRALIPRLLWPLVLASIACSSAACGDSGADGDAGETGSSDDSGADVGDPIVHAECEAPEAIVAGDAPEGCDLWAEPGYDDTITIQSLLIQAAPGDVVCLAAGTFHVDTELVLTTSAITILGAGQDETILDFSEQDIGANGIHVTGDGVTFEALRVQNTPGDGIRATGSEAIVFREVTVWWDADESDDNGAYGLYPVGCAGVRIEGCLVKGARDAGIYVGQSSDILVADSEAWGNVAGIEIENSVDSEVRGNHAHGNTAGILVFNLPDLPVQGGSRCVVHDNLIEDNNVDNFAPGGVVAIVPPGTGILVLATDDNEFRDNTITGNATAGAIVVSYLDALFGDTSDAAFDRWSKGNWFHHNTFTNNGYDPRGVVKSIVPGPYPLPAVLWDGCLSPDWPAPEDAAFEAIHCMSDNGDATFGNINLCGDFTDPGGLETVTCELEALPAIEPPTGVDVATLEPAPSHETCSKLSALGLFEGALADLTPAAGVVPYTVASSLWADHAEKARFIKLPDGEHVGFSADAPWTWPVGTVVIKTFLFPEDLGAPSGPRRIIETRLLTLTSDGWVADTFLWNDAQTDADWAPGGARVDVSYVDLEGTSRTEEYAVPNTEQCKSCHTRDGQLELLGPTLAQLNVDVAAGADGAQGQLAYLHEQGLFADAPPPADTLSALADPMGDGPLDDRARAWLHANCAHCHREGAAAANSGLFLSWDESDPTRLGTCKTPAAAGAGNGGLQYDIVPGSPDESILVFRIEATDPEVKMPELPNRLPHAAGIALIREWIGAMQPVDCQ